MRCLNGQAGEPKDAQAVLVVRVLSSLSRDAERMMRAGDGTSATLSSGAEKSGRVGVQSLIRRPLALSANRGGA